MKTLSALALSACLSALSAQAQPVDVELSVLPGHATAQGTRMTALRVKLPAGWKTYWRAPGDAGIPPLLSLEGTADAQLHWPTPIVFHQNGMRSVGYSENLVLPIEVPAGTDHLTGSLDIGVCLDICVPISLRFDAPLGPAGAPTPAIIAALLDQPQPGGHATCRLTQADDGLILTATLHLPPTGTQEAVVIETADPQVWVSEPQVMRAGDSLTATARLVRDGQAFALDRSKLRFTVLGSDRAVDVTGCTAG
ncbi:Thiol-disulfide interchange protein, contains DsbC and DsbD domains [Loktanella sp. DSM 29012]|uniref:protein-disulfide reductase DsbD domain-containing protein n=1 Tax=Loktanella sp. DSM 29012 TaxID=1881056 RepID=UPI0008BDED15|nr:protein-disulfide reductase DsbD domain-containing protein [Loktanella sp. DSM 29012]SEQ44643.1 Thiol-disulfide interchange protein, contains DsbC and DsbD domains [Loktanella sp. DSM 29012]